jgi:PAS domain S-box-containing protein
MMFQHNPLPMWVYDAETLRFLSVNQTAQLHYGYSEAEFLAMTIREIRPPEDLARLEEDLAAPAAGKEFSGPWRHRKKNGDIIEVEISSDAIHFPGRPARLVLASDITLRQQAAWRAAQLKTALTKSAREWRVTFDTLDIPVMLVGADGTVRRMNRAAQELTERGFPETIGHSLPQLSGVFPWSRTLALIRQAMDTKQPAGAQLRDHSSGRIWDCTANYFLNREGGDAGVVFSAREITGLVKLQESLRRGETLSALGSLVSGVAHEVRNPLFGIMATLDAFEANHGGNPEFREYLEILRGESERLSALMRDLLDYGRPPELNPARGSIEALLHDALKPVQALAQPAGVRLELECAAGLPEVSFDRSRLPQVFINLLDNAVRHSPSGGTVRLSAARCADPGWLEIAVLDEGPGIKPEDIPRLFQPFFTRRAGGTGLGLAICQRIIEQHGGHITAANRPEGGAVFTVRLPFADPTN